MKTVFCIFAHPDDEAFGPGGTIAKLTKRHRVYVLSATKGQAGEDKGKKARHDLGERRARELLRSAKILGARRVFFLGFQDGELSNSQYHKLAGKIERLAKRLKPEIFLTFEPHGISGHIDHITVSMVTNFVFERLPFVRTLLLACRTKERARAMKGYFIYVPPGYSRSEIDLIVDVRDAWDTKLRAMLAHESQFPDGKRILKFARGFPKEEYFLVRSKRPREIAALKAELF